MEQHVAGRFCLLTLHREFNVYAKNRQVNQFGRNGARARTSRHQPDSLARALVVADERQYPIMLEAMRKHATEALAELERQLVARPELDLHNWCDSARSWRTRRCE
jgi:hypothetical protein